MIGGSSPPAGPPAIVGTAGWSIPALNSQAFPPSGTALQRYAGCFQGVEINSSFHRPHRRSTWERWAASVPEDFRFAAKLPKAITHQAKLRGAEAAVCEFLDQAGAMGPKLAILLVQLPPSLAFDEESAASFFVMLGRSSDAGIACEPRHPSWFEPGADALLRAHRIARVAADPSRLPAAALPGGWRGLSYWRLHGSPIMYRSPYGPERLPAYADLIADEAKAGREAWCIFDNTASSAAMGDALMLRRLLEGSVAGQSPLSP